MRAILTFMVIAACIGLAPLSMADDAPPGDARAMLLSGQYDLAISMGETMGDAEGLSLVAESINAKVMLGYVEDAKDEAKHARKLAAKALKLDPESHEAHVQFALAYGFESQASGKFRAWRKNLPEKTRDAITAVREKFPEDPRGDALLGAWHLGIIRRVGADKALDWYDANEMEGMNYYETALEKSPNDIIMLSNYAAALLAIDAERHLNYASALLNRIEHSAAQNAIDGEMQVRMAELQKHYDNSDKLADLANRVLDGQKP